MVQVANIQLRDGAVCALTSSRESHAHMDTAELVRAGAGEGRSIEGSTKASGSSNVASVMATPVLA